MELVLYGIAGIVGAAIAGVAGFGSATVMIPLLGLMTDLPIAVAVVAVYHGATTASRLMLHFRNTHWRTVLIFGMPSLAAAYLGATLLSHVDSAHFQSMFGAILIAVAALGFLGWRPRWTTRTPLLATGGVASGFLAGFVGMGGAVRSLFLILLNLPKSAYLATGAAVAVFVDASRITAYIRSDLLHTDTVPELAILVPAAFLGSWFGKSVARKLPAVAFRRVVFGLLVAAGVKYLLL